MLSQTMQQETFTWYFTVELITENDILQRYTTIENFFFFIFSSSSQIDFKRITPFIIVH